MNNDSDSGSEPYKVEVRKGPPSTPVQSEPGSDVSSGQAPSQLEPHNADGVDTAESPAATHDVYQLHAPQNASSVLDQGPLIPEQSSPTDSPKPPKRPFRMSWRRTVGMTLVVVGLLAGVLLVLHNFSVSNKQAALNANLTDQSGRIKTQNVALPGLGQRLHAGASQAANTLTVNGSLVLAPSSKPSTAVDGELYYNQTANQMQYFNGTSFVSLQGGGNTSITNNTYGGTTSVTSVSGGGLSATKGTAGDLAMFTGSNLLGSSLINQSGNNLTTGTGQENVTIGSTAAASTTTIQGGVGNLLLDTGGTSGTSGTVTLESGDSSTTASGDVTVDTGSGFVSGTVVGDLTFEDDTTDNVGAWYGDTIAPTTVQAHDGVYSLAVTLAGGNWGIVQNDSGTQFIYPVVAGHHYFFSAWVRAGTTPRLISGYAFWVNSSNATLGTFSLTPVTDSTTGWTEISGSATAPAGASAVYMGFTGTGSAAGEVHYFDDIEATDLSSSSSTSSLNLGSADAQIVNIGNMNELGATTIEGGSGITLASGSSPITATGGAINFTGTAASSFGTSFGSLTLNAGGGTGGGVIVKPQSASTTAFQVQGTTTNLLTVDSTNNEISLGTGAGSSIGFTKIAIFTGGDINAGILNAQKVTTTAGGTISSMSAYLLYGAGPGSLYQFALYADNGSGVPGAYIASSAIGTRSTGGEWYTLPISATLTPNTTYWLVVWTSDTAIGQSAPFANGPGGPSSLTVDSNVVAWQGGSSNGFPATFPAISDSYSGNAISLYASYTGSGPALTVNQYGTMTQNGAAIFQDPTDSTQAFQIQDSLGNPLLAADTADMEISIGGNLTVSGDITVDGHFVTGGSSPAIATPVNCGAGPTATMSAGANDSAGSLTITVGSGSPTTCDTTVTFNQAYGSVPKSIILTPLNTSGGTVAPAAVYNPSTASFTIQITPTNAVAGSTYNYYYWVVQ